MIVDHWYLHRQGVQIGVGTLHECYEMVRTIHANGGSGLIITHWTPA